MILTAGERGVRQISGRVLSQELLLQVSVAARSARRHARRPNVLEDSLSHLRPGRTQLLRDVHHRHDHYQQLGIGQFSTASLAPGFDTWTPPPWVAFNIGGPPSDIFFLEKRNLVE